MQLGQTVYHRTTGEPWMVRSISPVNHVVWLKSENDKVEMYDENVWSERKPRAVTRTTVSHGATTAKPLDREEILRLRKGKR